MIQTMMNILFRCRHKRLTRPITPVQKTEARTSGTYVGCLDCGRRFNYDVIKMQMGAEVSQSSATGANSRIQTTA
jgi:hypothetical protein